MPTQELLPNSLIVSIYCIADKTIITSIISFLTDYCKA